MRRPPEPHFSFTIPSIHDDTILDCRIYHPKGLSIPRTQETDPGFPWRKRGIVMAHPYAPLGGSYDNPIVGIVIEEFLAREYVVGTFNFRGAEGSKGRTSWSGKPEVDDYISFAALFVHYLSYVHPHPAPDANFTQNQSPATHPTQAQGEHATILILGGYSHGSLILENLPPVPSILQPFSAPIHGSAAYEIVLRAHRLSDKSNLEWINIARDHEKQMRRIHANNLYVAMGGEETQPEHRRSSREVRRSMDGKRSVSIDIGNRLRSLSHKRKKHDPRASTPAPAPAPTIVEVRSAIEMPRVRYLLISPLTGPISLFAAPGLGNKFWHRPVANRELVGRYSTLIVYGDRDVFSSAKRVRTWAEKMRSEPRSQLSYVEVAGAGHFWAEPGVEEKLRDSLRDWEAQTWT